MEAKIKGFSLMYRLFLYLQWFFQNIEKWQDSGNDFRTVYINATASKKFSYLGGYHLQDKS